MRRDLARRMRTISRWMPSRVVSALLLGAWLALTLLFTFVGNVAVLTVATAMGQSMTIASLLVTVFGVFSTPAVSLVLARKVVASAVARVEYFVRRPVGSRDGGRLDSCETDDRGRCRTAACC